MFQTDGAGKSTVAGYMTKSFCSRQLWQAKGPIKAMQGVSFSTPTIFTYLQVNGQDRSTYSKNVKNLSLILIVTLTDLNSAFPVTQEEVGPSYLPQQGYGLGPRNTVLSHYA